MKRVMLIVAAVVAVAVLLPPYQTTAQTPIRIGASLPLTGRFSEPGSAAKQGYEVWTRLVNEKGGLLGRPVQMTVLDNASNQRTAVADYEKLITVDKVDLVVGPFSSFLVIPTSEVAARYGYAFVEPAGVTPGGGPRGRDEEQAGGQDAQRGRQSFRDHRRSPRRTKSGGNNILTLDEATGVLARGDVPESDVAR